MAQKFEIGMHTVIILVGPTQSGKSTWASIIQDKLKLAYPEVRCPILSSDEIRREILGAEHHRYDHRMTNASAQAFDLLKAKLKAYTTYPVNNELVIVDTTGMDAQFRSDIAQMARDQAYRVGVVMFDYSTSDYFKDVEPGREREIVGRSAEVFKKHVLPTIKRKDFDSSFSVKEKSDKFFKDLDVSISDYKVWKDARIESTKDVVFIGDIHEHVEALIEMQKILPPNTQVVLLGDYLDKGGKTAEVIPVVEAMIAAGAKVIAANHEAYVARRLKGEISKADKEEEFFTSLSVLQHDKDLAARFLAIYDQSIPFAFYDNEYVTVYATHAPCLNKYLGKMSDSAKKNQRNFHFRSRKASEMSKELEFVGQEAKKSHPIHVFGHVAHAFKNLEDKNKVWLDSGAVYGNKLSALIVRTTGERKLIHVATTALTEGEFFRFVKSEEPTEVSTDDATLEKKSPESEPKAKTQIEKLGEKYKLAEKDVFWLNDFINSGASFIAGTMSPSKSTANELEPVSEALSYYKAKGVEKIVIQPKFMGSRVQFYLHNDSSKDFLITRSGHKSRITEDTRKLLDYWSKKTKQIYGWTEQIIVDGELMPWSSIGQDLINRDFIPYGYAHLKENEILAQDKVFAQFSKFSNHNANWRVEHSNVFLKQVELYGKKGESYYCPFNVLKMDGNVYPFTSAEVFEKLNEHGKYLIVDLNNENALLKAEEFFNSLTQSEQAFEGIVIKPLDDRKLNDCVPYMKVRNENYLHIIYGYDYQLDYEKMCSQKRIGKKLMLSMKEYHLGKKMLLASKEELAEVACQMLFELKQEESIDTRL
jgi:predicted kinase